jgi:hypothetical protein
VDKDIQADRVFDLVVPAIMHTNQAAVAEPAALEKKIWMQTVKDKPLTAALV